MKSSKHRIKEVDKKSAAAAKKGKAVSPEEFEAKSKGWVGAAGTTFMGGAAESKPSMDFEKCEDYYLTVPTVFAAINMTAQMVAGTGFHLDGGSDEIRAATETFADAINLPNKALEIVKELLIYGNSFWERLDTFNIKWLPPTTFENEKSIDRDEQGTVKGYQQYVGREAKTQFKPEKIIHFKWNIVRNRKYGTSIIQPCQTLLDTKTSSEADMRAILKKHAFPFIIFLAQGADHQTFKLLNDRFASLEAGQNIVIATRGQTKVTAQPVILDSRARFQEYIDHIEDQITIGLQNPVINFGRSNARISDASATAMLDSFDRQIRTLQNYLSDTLQDQVLNPYIQKDFSSAPPEDYPEIVWGMVAKTTYDMRNIALLNQSVMRPTPNLAPNQIEYLYSMFGIKLPEAIWPEPVEIPQSKSLGDKIKGKLGVDQKTKGGDGSAKKSEDEGEPVAGRSGPTEGNH